MKLDFPGEVHRAFLNYSVTNITIGSNVKLNDEWIVFDRDLMIS